MKIYEEEGYIYLDYTDIDLDAHLNRGSAEYRDFIFECRHKFGIEWYNSLKPKVKQFYTHYEQNRKDFISLAQLRGRLLDIKSFVKYGRGYIDIEDSFNEFYHKINERFEELYRIEVERRRAEEQQRKRTEHWQYLCKHGCRGCSECSCVGEDDYECGATGDFLETKNVPEYYGMVYQLFNYVPFPTENCPYNVNKNKETKNEYIREHNGSSI